MENKNIGEEVADTTSEAGENREDGFIEIENAEYSMRFRLPKPSIRELFGTTLVDLYDDGQGKSACIITAIDKSNFKTIVYGIDDSGKYVDEETFNRYITDNHLKFRATTKQIVVKEGDDYIMNPSPADGKCELCGKKGTLKKCFIEDDEGIIIPFWKCVGCLKASDIELRDIVVMQTVNKINDVAGI